MSVFRIDDKVKDLTAIKRGWPDVYGTVLEDDGSNVKVKYESGTERWKRDINLMFDFRPTAQQPDDAA